MLHSRKLPRLHSRMEAVVYAVREKLLEIK